MKSSVLLFLLVICSVSGNSQRIHIGVLGGVSAYNGDLVESIFPKKVSNGIVGITGSYEITDQILARAGFSYTIVGGADRYNKDSSLKMRNLSFETQIWEFSAMGEYYLFNLNYKKYSPYIMAGVAAFRFNPYSHNGSTKVHLKPLSTEGQGISGYGKEYSLLQFALPVGIGVKFAITDNLRIGLEGGYRKLFTDFLDDVSGNYADPADLLANRGQLSVDMSYRSDEVGGSTIYPSKGAQRGSPKNKDVYYYLGIHTTYRLNGGAGGGKSKTGCPINVY